MNVHINRTRLKMLWIGLILLAGFLFYQPDSQLAFLIMGNGIQLFAAVNFEEREEWPIRI